MNFQQYKHKMYGRTSILLTGTKFAYNIRISRVYILSVTFFLLNSTPKKAILF